ncbi:MAG TPA: carboxypeptidase-like regulatory domain-containing protein, partial [Pinirhizobacter sp.]|uniref:carboxypeptidase-like regulatory domain-containing protein n=1 Tax=Pinirhizobacter sp. TaxID=2950432 RepID=UPI002CF78578
MNVNSQRRLRLRRTVLAVALISGLAGTGAVLAQSNASGAMFGSAPADSGSTVLIENTDTGFSREVAVDSSGRYRISSLPVGNYRVTLKSAGKSVSTRDNVAVNVGGGSEVSFTGEGTATKAQTLEGVSVVASALPTIDVSVADTRTVLTSAQLNRIPVARN